MKILTIALLLFLMNVSIEAAELERVIAHRGASYDAPENTSAAIALALERGSKIVEFDVRTTADGNLFLFHDSDLKRLCGIDGTFEALDSRTVEALNVGAWFTRGEFPDETPITLAAAISQCIKGGAVPLIEHKTGSAEAYAEIIKSLGVTDQVIVQSFNWAFIENIRSILPTLKIGALGSKQLSKRKTALLELKPDWVGWSDNDIKRSDIDWLRENGFHIAIWTVNDPRRAKYLLDSGVDKIITDRPKYLEENL